MKNAYGERVFKGNVLMSITLLNMNTFIKTSPNYLKF